jgi:REP element-mobilizing transposase RayT
MSQSLSNVLLHLVFSTKNRVPYLKDPQIRETLDAYFVGTLKNLESPSLITKSVEDHVHILCQMSKQITISGLIKEIKIATSSWLKKQSRSLKDFHWQSGYGAFSVSQSRVGHVRRYILNQEEHHKTVSFQDELRALLKKHKIEFDERYLWD